MANVIPFAFRGELFTGTHNFATSEVSASGTNYTTTGNALTGNAVVATTAVASTDFADSTWASATFTAAFGAIYNDDQGDKLCVVLDFSGDKTATNGTFKVTFPSPATAADAIISMA
jgi:uncharacterized Ntn-hydrolase superfamily protein